MNYYLQILTAVEPLGGFRLAAAFADGYRAEIDLSPWIARGGIRTPLSDPAVFAAVQLDELGAPQWPGEIDLSSGTLRAWCEAGRVMTKEETDAWIAEHTGAAQDVA